MTDDEMGANPETDFATLLNSYSPAGTTDLQIGNKVRGKIISISHDTIFVDIGNKIDGVVERTELLDENKELLATTIAEETGKPLWETRTEAAAIERLLEIMAHESTAMIARMAPARSSRKRLASRRPMSSPRCL